MSKKIHLLFLVTIGIVFFKVIDLTDKESTQETMPIVDSRSYLKSKKIKRADGMAKLDQPEMYGLIQQQLRTPIGENLPQYEDNYLVKEFKKAKRNQLKSYSRMDLNFISRGPGNVAGRTRALLVDPRDPLHNTWIAGSASGGVWKTETAGKEWTNISGSLTTLSTNTLAMSPNNPDVIYLGTGEHFINDTDGNGLWKSSDGGETWQQIASPEDYVGFKNVARIAVDPNNENIVVVATSNGSWVEVDDYAIWKSIDGGATFERKYTSQLGRIDDINANPMNFNTMYAAVEDYGVIKSTDAGETWFEPGDGLIGVARVEIDVSPVDTSRVWASAVGGSSKSGSTVYLSLDGAVTFSPLNEEAGNVNYLDDQGFYDNIITAHPYNEDEAYVGGVNLFKVSVVGEGSIITDFRVNRGVTEEFLTFISGTDFEREARVAEEDIKSVEIRFGQGSQKAHRFSVGNQGAGVPFGSYQYKDYVDVPFTVWDTDNDVQLAVSFRDQGNDGAWNLMPRNTDGDPVNHSREYLFIHDTTYTDNPNDQITRTGGNTEQLMYFIWPALQVGANFQPGDLPESALFIEKVTVPALENATTVISDAYGEYNDINSFSNEEFINQQGVHPDQHNIVVIKENEEEQTFRFIATNDGGAYITKEDVNPGSDEGDFTYAGFGYNTSQFYGADKAPGEQRYIGGMQDNSTWYTPAGMSADSSSRYNFAFGGDGFEAIWNNSNPSQIIGSSQFNNFARTLDGGLTWRRATMGLTEGGPFVSRLANSKRDPNTLFTVGSSGVWKSTDFGGNWELREISERWSFGNVADIEVSHASADVIWAGGFLSEGRRIFVSQDKGESWTAVSNYEEEEMGFVSGIGTHASEPGTAYLLFSFAGKPKVIKSEDYGQTWEDISGFAGNEGVSDRGFPDVAIQSLLVFPNNTDRIWVGSEIGIIESLDGGASWNLLESNMPPVYVHEFKIQDDEVVLATYGRGIWSVKVDGIEQNFLLSPSITNAVQNLQGSLKVDYFLPSEYDSSKIYIDGDLVEEIGERDKGGFTTQIPFNNSGETIIEIQSYFEDSVLTSSPYIISTYVPGPAVNQYSNDFSEEARADEFLGFGFRIALEDGFTSEAIHSDHPHPNGVDYTWLLTQPYILSEGKANEMQFREVVIIEPGEEGAVFGDGEFWDYVVVEGSKDGQNWTAVLPGYDSRSDEDWLSAYETDGLITEDLYRYRNINLEETYEIGDTVILRFRLNSDQFVTGWGWAIDDLEIGDVTSGFLEVNVTQEISIYPNPVISILNIETDKELANAEIYIYDINGQFLSVTQGVKSLDVSALKAGTYLLRVQSEEINETIKFLKI